MKIPRDLSGSSFVQLLSRSGYVVTRQTGSHIRLTTQAGGEHHVTVPAHGTLRVGTLSGVLMDIANHLGRPKSEVAQELFG